MARMRRRRIVIVGLLAALAAACQVSAPQAALIEQDRIAMGSSLRVSIWTTDQDRATKAIDAVYSEFDRLEDALSVWRPESDVQRLNAAAGKGPVPVGIDMFQVLEEAEKANRLTLGKFDITFGALADIWKFDHDQDDRVPAYR